MKLNDLCCWLFHRSGGGFLNEKISRFMLFGLALFIVAYYMGLQLSHFRMSIYVFVVLVLFSPLKTFSLQAFRDPLFWNALVLGSYMAITALWHKDSFDILVKEFRHLLLLLFFVLGVSFLQYKVNIVRYVQVVLFLVCTLMGVISLVDFYSIYPFSKRLEGYGILTNSAQLVYGLGLGAVCGFSLLLTLYENKFRRIVWAGLLFILGAAVLTGSRGGLIGIGVVAATYIYFAYGMRHCAIFLVCIILMGMYAWAGGNRVGSIVARFEIWKLVFDGVGDQWLWGVGADGRDLSNLLGSRGSHAHSMYFSIYYRGGVVGILFFSWLLLSMGGALMKLRKSEEAIFLSMIFSFVLIVSIADLGDLFWRPTYLWMYFWFPFALLVGESIYYRKKTLSAKEVTEVVSNGGC